MPSTQLSEQEMVDLRWAHRHLEHPSLAARLSNAIGTPIEFGLKLLPRSWYDLLHQSVEQNIRQTLTLAIGSMAHVPRFPAHNMAHKIMAMGTGAVGGFFGPATLLAELPITTAHPNKVLRATSLKFGAEHCIHKTMIPPRELSHSLKANPRLIFLHQTQQIQYRLLNHRDIGWRIPFSYSAVIIAKANIQDPM